MYKFYSYKQRTHQAWIAVQIHFHYTHQYGNLKLWNQLAFVGKARGAYNGFYTGAPHKKHNSKRGTHTPWEKAANLKHIQVSRTSVEATPVFTHPLSSVQFQGSL